MRKRVNGEGSVSARPRSDGLWVARYTVVDEGVTRRPALYGKTRAEAARKLRAALTARDDQLRSRVGMPSVGSSAPRSRIGAASTRPEASRQGGRAGAVGHPRVKYIRIADVTSGLTREVWIHPDSIESIEANGNGQTILRLRSGRPLLVDRHIDVVLGDLGPEHS
ncbi:MAG: hypothetical protein JF886_08665 [Candidatus Dormibacteraeota bacterium]|uniref:Uncharacterized protein n=1 Tax=Candidatus Aeolococcus gillhamiae TaxID=3127015 RepID=A0A2W5Z6V5_9BACT|nr:hypothetical protein [Candidatus Dormibacteraeota bacterium]PZR81003.1 MAG: hypothetical protein DLM65_06855 [Candidatus Dormibacter sp. RRmetagenome_bin12]